MKPTKADPPEDLWVSSGGQAFRYPKYIQGPLKVIKTKHAPHEAYRWNIIYIVYLTILCTWTAFVFCIKSTCSHSQLVRYWCLVSGPEASNYDSPGALGCVRDVMSVSTQYIIFWKLTSISRESFRQQLLLGSPKIVFDINVSHDKHPCVSRDQRMTNKISQPWLFVSHGTLIAFNIDWVGLSSANRRPNVVEEFERLSDPGSYVVRGISPW